MITYMSTHWRAGIHTYMHTQAGMHKDTYVHMHTCRATYIQSAIHAGCQTQCQHYRHPGMQAHRQTQ